MLINDTVGTVMSTAYYDRKTALGLILGTGTNACYIENIDRIGILDSFVEPDQKQVKILLENFKYEKKSYFF